jgi:hypothetical protein
MWLAHPLHVDHAAIGGGWLLGRAPRPVTGHLYAASCLVVGKWSAASRQNTLAAALKEWGMRDWVACFTGDHL